MKFYQAIAKYYDQIFPLNLAQIPFTLNAIGPQSKKLSILDVGCATGNFAVALRNTGADVTAIDLDSTMIQLAQKKAPDINFFVLNMLEISEFFQTFQFDIISCYGNTLVHLESENQINSFLRQTRAQLKSGGKLLLQILNYDFILDAGITHLPLIENEYLRFERSYRQLESNKLAFDTRLLLKNTNEILENSVSLIPLRQLELEKLLRECGFSTSAFYNNFSRTAVDRTLPLIAEAE